MREPGSFEQLYPPEKRGINLDFDWIYRKALPTLIRWIATRMGRVGERLSLLTEILAGRTYRLIYRLHGPEGVFARTWTTGAIAFWAVLGLFGFLLLYFWGR